MSRHRLAHPKEVKLDTVFEPDEGGWHVYVPSLKGCRTWGRSLTEARRNIREAISLQEEAFDDADAVARDAVLVEDIRLPAVTRRLLQHARAAKARADAQTVKAKAASAEAARKMTEVVSLRDAGELLGLSQEGVRKILPAKVNPLSSKTVNKVNTTPPSALKNVVQPSKVKRKISKAG